MEHIRSLMVLVLLALAYSSSFVRMSPQLSITGPSCMIEASKQNKCPDIRAYQFLMNLILSKSLHMFLVAVDESEAHF